MLDWVLPRVLLILGAGFLLANVRLLLQFVRFLRLRSSALLVWPGRKPPAWRLFLAMAIVLAVVIFIKLVVQKRTAIDVFGESMMLLYYTYLVPVTVRIGRGFYRDGVWMEDGFLPYANIGGLSWREEPQGREITLLLIPRMKRLAHRLIVPQQHYAAARRLLRDKIKGNDVHFTGKALDLGDHDERDDV